MNCPICKNSVTDTDPEVRPFCSPRCKKLDLSNWLEGKYRLPRELLPEDLEQLPQEEQDELIAHAMGETLSRDVN